MPNWCDNMVTLRNSDKSKIDALVACMTNKEDQNFMNHLRPNPSGQWEYNWSVENWGTKWDATIIDWEHRDDNEVWVSFESAWSPPTALYEYLVEEGWEVEALYHEPGMGYAGMHTTEDGDEYFEYDLSEPDSIEDLPEDLIEFGNLRSAAEDFIIYKLEEEWGDAERTEWYPADVNPAYVGYYEITTSWDFPQFCKWDGSRWVNNYNEIVKWRGLAAKPEENIE